MVYDPSPEPRGRASAVEQAQAAAPPGARDTVLLDWICHYIRSQGLTFPREVVADYYVALKSKPFVILTGVSGTGKTQLTKVFADAISGADSGHYLLVPVAPDWTDDTALMGYYNVVREQQVETQFSRFYHWAEDARDEPFFVCLDEMNLAKVEHYFSHFLSAMEMGGIPANLFITGTVNVDESTYQFSKKVLDRANTIEFNEVYLLDRPIQGKPYEEFTWQARRQMFEIFLSRHPKSWDEEVVTLLNDINAILSARNLQFAYRVRDEVLRFMGNSAGLLDRNEALDLQILQKVLPRVSGTKEQVEKILVALLGFLLNIPEEALPSSIQEFYLLDPAEYGGIRYARSAKKTARMIARVREDGFVTFYE